LSSYGLLLRWQLLRLRIVLPLIVIVQTALAVSVVLGFVFLAPTVDRQVALYLATGAPTLGLLVVGLATAPQLVSQAKLQGSLDYLRALPVPRLAYLFADLTVWFVTALPGLAAALLVAALRFDLDYRISLLVVPAVVLTAVTATALGYGLAYALSPSATAVATQLLVLVVLLFSPITYPAGRLPAWLSAVHDVLPFRAMGDIVRGALTGDGSGTASAYLLVALWCAVGLVTTYTVMLRRD